MAYVDLHCDTASLLLDNIPLYENDGMLSVVKLQKAKTFCQFFAMFVNMGEFAGPPEGYEYMRGMYSHLMEELEINREYIRQARSAQEIWDLRNAGKIAAVLSIEEGGVIGESLDKLDELYNMGVRLITLTWNYENSLGFPNSEDADTMERGLKPFGKDVVERMEELGMLIDVSHLSDGGFWDVADICRKPFVASHSNARAICGHPRNLADNMLKALGEAGGVVGLNFFYRFLGGDETGSIAQMVKHIKHIHNVAGSEALALGSDFDGFQGACGIKNCSELALLAEALKKEGFSESEIDKICWKNPMRVIEGL